ncbi:MAG TPA: cupredoxin domain-containing protein [Solirubrobacterales bacterium]|nr:cupredoxin domain-containing protein [Solirubrobacterales bacterium]
MHWRRMLGSIAVIALVAAAVTPGAHARGEPEATITVGNNFLSPAKKTIAAGTKLEFRWVGGVRHHIVKTKGPGGDVRSPATSARGINLAHTFNKRGTYKFICTIHPTEMHLNLTVAGGSAHQ